MGIAAIGISIQPQTTCPEPQGGSNTSEELPKEGRSAPQHHQRFMSITECVVQQRMNAFWRDPHGAIRTGAQRKEMTTLIELDAFLRYQSGRGTKLSGASVEYEAMRRREKGETIDTAPLHQAILERNDRFLDFYEEERAKNLTDEEKWEEILKRRPHYPKYIPESFFAEPDVENLEFLYELGLTIAFVTDVEKIQEDETNDHGMNDSLATDPDQRKANCYARSVIVVDLTSLIGWGQRLRSLQLPTHQTLEMGLAPYGPTDTAYLNYGREFLPGTYYTEGGARVNEKADPPWTVISGALVTSAGIINDKGQLQQFLYEASLGMDPDNYAALVSLGYALYINDRLKESEARYRAAITVNEKYFIAYFGLALLLSEQPKRRQEAVALYERALEINPDYEPARQELDALLKKMGLPPSSLTLTSEK